MPSALNRFPSGKPDTATVSRPRRLSLYHLPVGATVNLSAIMTPGNATLRGVSFRTSDPSIATVEPGGRVRGISSGTVTITATSDSGAIIRTAEITVIVPVTSITLEERSIRLQVGETHQIVYTILPRDATNQSAAFSSRNTNIASVDEYGLVIANRQGTTVITVRVDGRSVNLSVRVDR